MRPARRERDMKWHGLTRLAGLLAVLGGIAGASAVAGAGVIPPPDESHANHPIGVCGNRHFDPRMEICDTRNNHLYRITRIGDQTWMAENLDFGRVVPGRRDQAGPGEKYCLYDDTADCGALYQWATVNGLDGGFNARARAAKDGGRAGDAGPVQGICPEGWRVPSAADWETMLGVVRKEQGAENEAVSLMAYSANDKFRWKTNTDPDAMLPLHDRYGMAVLPFGQRVLRGTCPDGPPADSFFCSAHDMAKFWTSDEDPADPATGVSITMIEDLPRVWVSSKPPYDMLTPAQKAQWISLEQRKAASQSPLQRSYKPSVKVLGMAVRCIKR
jgi:uncharacterized protein (TIGR02145 family)